MSQKKFWGTCIIILLFSCGIPSFEYISEPEIISSTDDAFEIEIDLTSSSSDAGEIIYFEIYSRYFPIDEDDSSELLDDITLSEIGSGVEKFLVDNGFSIVKYFENRIITKDEESDLLDKIDIPVSSSNINYTVSLNDTDDGDRIVISSSDLDQDYYLLSTYDVKNENVHFIGEVSDNLRDKLEEDFEDLYQRDQEVNIEFVVVNYGVSSSLTSIESLPVLVNKEFTIR